MTRRTTDSVMEKLYPFILDVQASLDKHILYMITISLLKISIQDKKLINAVLDKWMSDFFSANVEGLRAKIAEVFGEEENPEGTAPLHLVALQSVTGIVKKTLMDLLEAFDNISDTTKEYVSPSHLN